MKTADQIFEEATRLPINQRFRLVRRLLAISEEFVPDEVEHEWELLIRQRIDRYDQGLIHSRPASEVFMDLDKKLGG